MSRAPAASAFPPIGTGHLKTIAAPGGRRARAAARGQGRWSNSRPLRARPQQIDDVERGANDSDWQPAKDAAQKIAYAEDRAIFEGYAAAQIEGVRQGTSNPIMTLPADVRQYPTRSPRRSASCASSGSTGPIRCCSAPTPIRPSPRPATTATRAGARQEARQRRDHLGPGHRRRLRPHHARRRFRPAYRPGRLDRLSQPHDDSVVRLYLQETLTFLLLTSEASVALAPPATRPAT